MEPAVNGGFGRRLEHNTTPCGGSTLDDRFLSDVHDPFDGLLAQPNPSFQVSPSVVTSFFHMGACFLSSSMSHSQA